MSESIQFFKTCSPFYEVAKLPSCFYLEIASCIFQDFQQNLNNLNHSIWVNPDYNMKYFGIILDLDNFKGNIKISSTYFYKLYANYYSCDIAKEMDTTERYYIDDYP